MKRIYMSMLVLMMSSALHAADTDGAVLSDSCTQDCSTQSSEKPICDSLNRFTVNCLKTTGGVTVGTFLTVSDGASITGATTMSPAAGQVGLSITGNGAAAATLTASSSSFPALILIGSSNNVNSTPLRLVNIPTSGAFTAIGVDGNGNVIFSPSSRRFKENIHDVGVDAEKMYALEPVTFDYTTEHGGAKNVFGLIAEDVEQHLPNIVVYGNDGKPYSVAYQMLIPLLVKEMQKHKHELTVLRERVKTLENRV